MKRTSLLLFICISFFARAQQPDSAKKTSHDLGFNASLLLKQLVNNSNVPQLPYQLIYTVHFNGKLGIRAGAGFNMSNDRTSITGQSTPRVSESTSLFTRVGANYNFLKHRKVTANVFVDALYESGKTRTVNSFTTFGSPQTPTTTVVNELNEKSTGIGAQAGIGLRWSFTRHLALYTEMPFQFRMIDSESKETNTRNGIINQTTNESTSGTRSNFVLPATIYLLIRF